MNNQFYKQSEARKKMPVVSRPDLVAQRNRNIADETARKLVGPLDPPLFDTTPTDHRMKCYRPDGTCYAILSPLQWISKRERGALEKFLKKERDSGVILEVMS